MNVNRGQAAGAFKKLLKQSESVKSNIPSREPTYGGDKQLKTAGYAKLNLPDESSNLPAVPVWCGPATHIQPVIPFENCPPVSLCVKVWAELADESNNPLGTFVNIQKYKWKAKQRFYLWMESPIPVQVSLAQFYDVGPQEAKKPKLVMPDTKKPLSFATVVPGSPFRHPQVISMDNNLADEFAMLTIIQAGALLNIGNGPAAPLPINTLPENPTQAQCTTAAQQTITVLQNATQSVTINTETLKPSGPTVSRFILPTDAAPSVQVTKPGETDDVAMFALSAGNMGHLPLRFRK